MNTYRHELSSEFAGIFEKLGIILPPPPKPVGLYRPAVTYDERLLFISGHGPWIEGKPITGKLGAKCGISRGQFAAYHVALGVLSNIQATVGLDRVDRILDVTGFVNSTPRFKRHADVMNGFSQVMVDVFGEDRGAGARTAIGAISLPFGIACEAKCLVALKA